MLNLLVSNDVFCSQLVGHAVNVWLCLSVEDDESLTGRFGNRSRKRFVMLTRPAQLQTAPLVMKCYFHVNLWFCHLVINVNCNFTLHLFVLQICSR